MPILLERPKEENSFYNPSFRYQLQDGIYFVFGSNLKGVHGAGGAKIAVMDYGAVYGLGEGFQGQSYAIPTKDTRLNILPLDIIKTHVQKFVEATQITNNSFFVTAVGTGLAKYKHSDIAPLFKGVRNCWLPEPWKEYIL